MSKTWKMKPKGMPPKAAWMGRKDGHQKPKGMPMKNAWKGG